jgi:hypothetical protein
VPSTITTILPAPLSRMLTESRALVAIVPTVANENTAELPDCRSRSNHGSTDDENGLRVAREHPCPANLPAVGRIERRQARSAQQTHAVLASASFITGPCGFGSFGSISTYQLTDAWLSWNGLAAW